MRFSKSPHLQETSSAEWEYLVASNHSPIPTDSLAPFLSWPSTHQPNALLLCKVALCCTPSTTPPPCFPIFQLVPSHYTPLPPTSFLPFRKSHANCPASQFLACTPLLALLHPSYHFSTSFRHFHPISLITHCPQSPLLPPPTPRIVHKHLG